MKHLDLFSGIGGFSLALDQVANASHEFVEYEPHLQRVLAKNWPTSNIHGDIRKFSADYSPDLVTGGFPCQDISRANTNKNKGGINGERSGLWTEYFRVLGECRPKYCIIENVYDLLGNGLGKILRDLACIGYDSAWTVIDSQYTGVPQRRRRVYILGVRDGITKGADIFGCNERSGFRTVEFAKRVSKERNGIFKEAVGKREAVAYFTKQRTDELNSCGVASTIAKRDWKSNTDLILHRDGTLRGLTVSERMKLQGIPSDWMNGCGLTTKQEYAANGMTVPAVKWVVERMISYDKTLDI
jgi:DNA-cytosine methyltransferase